jgi:hypothetical protein
VDFEDIRVFSQSGARLGGVIVPGARPPRRLELLGADDLLLGEVDLIEVNEAQAAELVLGMGFAVPEARTAVVKLDLPGGMPVGAELGEPSRTTPIGMLVAAVLAPTVLQVTHARRRLTFPHKWRTRCAVTR